MHCKKNKRQKTERKSTVDQYYVTATYTFRLHTYMYIMEFEKLFARRLQSHVSKYYYQLVMERIRIYDMYCL